MKLERDENGLCYVWLIWGLKPGVCDLLGIATDDANLDRLKTSSKTLGYSLIQPERAALDHAFGWNMIKAMRAWQQ